MRARERPDDASHFIALLARILTLNPRLFPGPAYEGRQQRSGGGCEPGLPAVTGLREQDAYGAPFQQTIRHMRPAGLEDHGRSDAIYAALRTQGNFLRSTYKAREIYSRARLSRTISAVIDASAYSPKKY